MPASRRRRAERRSCAYSFPGLKSSPGVAGAGTPSGRGPCGRRRRRGGNVRRHRPRSRRAAIDLRLRSGDEGRQAIDADIVGIDRLRLRLRLKLVRLLTMLALAADVRGADAGRAAGRAGPRADGRAVIVVARHERLRLHRNEAGLLAEIRKALALVVAVLRGHFIFGARLRLVLAELLLGSGDQAEIMLGMLVVVLGGYRIAGRARVARQLHVFFGDMGCGAADLDVGSVGFEHPGHRVLAAPVGYYCCYYCCCYCSGYASACCCSDRFSCLAFIPALKLKALNSSLELKP